MQAMNRKIGIGVIWNLAGLVMNTGASTIVTLILARILVPEIFGLMAMITIVFDLAGALINSGFSQALIRAKTVDQRDLSTVFFANIALSLLAYAALYASAPFVAGFYDQPELALLIRVTGIVVLFNALKIVQTAVLSRAMNFSALARAGVAGVVVSGAVAAGLAYWGMGVWSLVAQMVTASAASAGVLWFSSTWRPSFVFSLQSFRPLFAFASRLMLDGVLVALFRNAHPIVIGRFFSAEATGLYFLATRFNGLLAEQFTNAVQSATFPALSTLQDENRVLREKYRQILSLVLFVVAPVVLLLAAVAEPLFVYALGEKWRQAALYFQFLCFVGVLYPLQGLNVNIMYVKGRSDLVLHVGIFKKVTSVALLFLFLPWGVFGIIVGQIIASVIALGLNGWFSTRLIEYSLFDQAKDALRPIGSAALAALIAWAIIATVTLHPLAEITLASCAGAFAYLLISYLTGGHGLFILIALIRRRLIGAQKVTP